MSLVIVYVPGLGRKYDGFRRRCLSIWRIFGIEAVFVAMNWTDGRDFAEKQQRLKAEIARHANVVVVGESAGAAAALSLLRDKPPQLKSVITLCGVTQAATPIALQLRRRAPALRQARDSLADAASSTVPIHSVIALHDPVIAPKYAVPAGARIHRVFSVGHLVTIMLCLTLFAPYLIRIARKSVL